MDRHKKRMIRVIFEVVIIEESRESELSGFKAYRKDETLNKKE